MARTIDLMVQTQTAGIYECISDVPVVPKIGESIYVLRKGTFLIEDVEYDYYSDSDRVIVTIRVSDTWK